MLDWLPLLEWLQTLPKLTKPNYNNLTLSDLEAIKQGCYWDSSESDRIIEFIQTYCLQSKYPFYGQPIKLLTWQKKLIRNLFSWFKSDGTLRYKKLACFIPKKNGKSTLVSCLALYKLVATQGSSIMILASDLTEAGNVFNEAANMAEMHDDLRELLWVRRSLKSIEYEETKSIIKVLSGMPTGKSGHNLDLLIYDELSMWRASSARSVWDQMEGSNATKPNSLKLIITTSGFTKESNIGYEQYQRAKSILSGQIIDTTILNCIYEVDESDDWTNKEVQEKANPSVGHTFTKEYLAEQFAETRDNPAKENEFRVLKLNQWLGRTGYISSYKWGLCVAKFEEKDYYGSECYIGLDISRAFDLTSYCVLIKKEDKYIIIPRIFTPNDIAAKKAIQDGVPYLLWQKSGHIKFSEGDTIDHELIRQCIQEDIKNFKVLKILYDPYGMAETRQLIQTANEDIPVEEVPQGYAGMSAPTAIFERLVREGKVIHNNNPCVNWCFSNITLRQDAFQRLIPAKQKSRGRIDAAVAILIALVGWIAHIEEPDIDYTPFLI